MIRVLVVDDHPVVLAGVVRVLESDDGIEVVGTAGEGAAAVRLEAELEADVVLMDLGIPGIDGMDATRQIVHARPGARVVVVSGSCTTESVLGSFDAGAIGYLLKDSDPWQLVSGVHAAAGGGSPLDPAAAAILVEERAARLGAVHLSQREFEVLELVSRGLLNKQIARVLGITEKTVKAHLSHVYEQFGVERRTDAVRWARAHEILDPADPVEDVEPPEAGS